MHATFAVQLAVLAGVALVAPVGGVAAGGVARSALRPRALVLLAAPKKAKAAAGGGFGKVAAAPSGPTAKELLAQATKTYEAMEALSAAVGDEVTTVSKWSITLRAEGVAELSDWVPVARLALNCPQARARAPPPPPLGLRVMTGVRTACSARDAGSAWLLAHGRLAGLARARSLAARARATAFAHAPPPHPPPAATSPAAQRPEGAGPRRPRRRPPRDPRGRQPRRPQAAHGLARQD
jgi:hypothetical protein